MRKTYKYFISLLLCFALLPDLQAQKPDVKKTPAEKKDTTKVFNGLTVYFDAASLVTTLINSNDYYSLEGGVQFNLKKKYYPVVEIGFAGANKLSSENIGFVTNAPFGRIGIDVNVLKPKENAKPTNNLFFAGLRLGMTRFSYDINNVVFTDDYWGGSQTVNYSDQKATKAWFEIVGGIKVEVIKHLYMGWTVRIKNLITKDKDGVVSPWYIPGYGKTADTNWGLNYSIGLRL